MTDTTDTAWRGQLGVKYAGSFNILSCAECTTGQVVAAMNRSTEDNKARVWLMCPACSKVLTAIDSPERLMVMIEAGRAADGK